MGLELKADLDDVERCNHEAGDEAGDGAGEDDLLASALLVLSSCPVRMVGFCWRGAYTSSLTFPTAVRPDMRYALHWAYRKYRWQVWKYGVGGFSEG